MTRWPRVQSDSQTVALALSAAIHASSICLRWPIVCVSALVAWLQAPANVSSNCDELLDQLNDVSFLGNKEFKDSCMHLRWSLTNLNRSQGLGFLVFSVRVPAPTHSKRFACRSSWCAQLLRLPRRAQDCSKITEGPPRWLSVSCCVESPTSTDCCGPSHACESHRHDGIWHDWHRHDTHSHRGEGRRIRRWELSGDGGNTRLDPCSAPPAGRFCTCYISIISGRRTESREGLARSDA
jgi:hypothetical protein